MEVTRSLTFVLHSQDETSGLEQHHSQAAITAANLKPEDIKEPLLKVLEFDTVLIMPSLENFPLGSSRQQVNLDAAEEDRLCYVAMTRAHDRLYIGWGDLSMLPVALAMIGLPFRPSLENTDWKKLMKSRAFIVM